MPVRTGAEYVAGLKARPRDVWVGGEQVCDVIAHPAFRRPTARLAALFDLQHDRESRDTLTYASPATGDPVATAFMPAHDSADLGKKHAAYRAFAEATLGMMGRSPDFMNCTLLAFAEGAEVFARGGDRFGENIVRYYEFVRENDLFLTHALMSPQNDRSKASSAQAEEDLHLGLVSESDEGIVVSRRPDDRDARTRGRRGADLQHPRTAARRQKARAGLRGSDRRAGAAPDLPRTL